ncbi:hypothetical protein E6H22_01330 [Candidatus Bathyarchaeota archaeon]|nr:MAG: hypothetical protein E6H22_01330 [Candidatus Bathyarchaeota archaeon]
MGRSENGGKEKKPKKPKKAKATTKAKAKAKAKAPEPLEEKDDPVLEEPEQIRPVKPEIEEKPEEIPEEKEEEVKAEEAPEAPAEAEEAEEEELEIVEEKFYDLNLRRIWNAPREKRTPRAIRFLREFVSQRMKTNEVSISEETNSMLWQRGISKPPRRIRIRVVKDKEGKVIVFPGEGK